MVGKSLNIWTVNNTPLNNTYGKEEFSRQILKYFKRLKMKIELIKLYGILSAQGKIVVINVYI